MANSGEVLCVREKEKRKRERGGDCRRRSHWRDDDEDERILPLSLSFSCCVYQSFMFFKTLSHFCHKTDFSYPLFVSLVRRGVGFSYNDSAKSGDYLLIYLHTQPLYRVIS
ncbi:hypothetical protein L2E82_47671 [Cichorium intybus]|uniref:Uncharacterized protein n=1 Tax=Cichorium intybus TaxID=13427 RepID=A0ACB8YW71_CICIN|nr:hypothetical protein L2E82_47671 [Cichorium intybus]